MIDPSDTEIWTLVSQLTLEEKLSLLAGKSMWETVPVERLNIPSLKVTDGPNGARGGAFVEGTTAACFPASVSLASTFDTSLARRVGVAIAQEATTKGAYVLLGPTICLHRSPLGGRNFESFSEDPLLTGKLASQYIQGVQSKRVGATPKHFAVNEQETRRFTVNGTVSERALRELYLKPFEMVVKEARPWCMMSSYPKVNGDYIDSQPYFLQYVLRDDWKYEGMVMSDWAAVTNADKSVKYGLDLEMPGPPERRKPENIHRAIKEGTVSIEDIDQCVFRNLQLLSRVGKFTDRRETPEEQAVKNPEHSKLIRQVGADGIVVLRNENNVLPLKTFKKVALIGPLAKVAAAHGGGSASLNSHYKVSPYNALSERLPDHQISYSQGCMISRALPDFVEGAVNKKGNPGFLAEMYDNLELQGEPFHVQEFPGGSFTTIMNEQAQGTKAVRFSSTYTPAITGKHCVSFSGVGPSKLYINDELISSQEREISDAIGFMLGSQEEARISYQFNAGKKYDILIETMVSPNNNSELWLLAGQVAAHLGFMLQGEYEADLLGEAVEAAKDADVAICFVGRTAQWETEGQDMTSMKLPVDGSQDRLISEVAKVNPNTVVVLTTGSPVELPWINEVSGLIQAWYAGQEIGNAIVDVLTGEVNPSGRLPVSWPKKEEDTPCYGHFGMDSFESRKVEYVEGINVGYRHFDRTYGTDKEVLFPFGFGLSYTSFDINNLKVSGQLKADDDSAEVIVTVNVKNTGTVPGSQTVQLYLAPPRNSTKERPPQALVAFAKIRLEPDEQGDVTMAFKRDGAAFWDESCSSWAVEKGAHELRVAKSSHWRDIAARETLNVPEDFCLTMCIVKPNGRGQPLKPKNVQYPPKIRPYAGEILAYADHMHNHMGRRLYLLLSRILGLEDDALWQKVPGKNSILPHSSYCRFQVYHPLKEEDRTTTDNILPNHNDHGATTFLPSQPGALVCNLGDVMEILSGGILKATRHRVCKPPADQQGYERASVCSFNHADQDLALEPLEDAPLIKQLGVQRDSEVYGAFCKAMERGEKIPKFGEWKTLRNKNAQEPTSKFVEINERCAAQRTHRRRCQGIPPDLGHLYKIRISVRRPEGHPMRVH